MSPWDIIGWVIIGAVLLVITLIVLGLALQFSARLGLHLATRKTPLAAGQRWRFEGSRVLTIRGVHSNGNVSWEWSRLSSSISTTYTADEWKAQVRRHMAFLEQ